MKRPPLLGLKCSDYSICPSNDLTVNSWLIKTLDELLAAVIDEVETVVQHVPTSLGFWSTTHPEKLLRHEPPILHDRRLRGPGVELEFKNNNRPCRRYLYYHYCVSILRAVRFPDPGIGRCQPQSQYWTSLGHMGSLSPQVFVA